MSEFNEGSQPEPLPEDKDLTAEAVNAAPQVQEAERIMRRAKARIENNDKLPELTPEEREALREIKPEEVPNIVQSSIERAKEVIRGLREEIKAHPKDDSWSIRLERANLELNEMEKAQKLLKEHGATGSSADLRNLGNFVLTKKEALENLWHPPEPHQQSYVFDLAEAPNIMRDSVTRAEEVTNEIQAEVRAHPADPTLVKKLEIAHQYLDRMRVMHERFLDQRNQGLGEKEIRRMTNFILIQGEDLKNLVRPAAEPQRWPGMTTHEASTAEAAEGSYEAAIREASGETEPDLEEEPTDTTDPFDYMAAITATANRLHTRQSELPEITEQHSQKMLLVENARQQAHDIIVGWRHLQDIPGVQPEHIELETDHVRKQLRELLSVVERYEEEFEQ